MKKLLREFHRRSVWQVLSVYLAVSWGVLQVVDQLTESAGLPDWTPAFALVLLLLGLPVIVATAVVQRGAPGLGGERESALAGEGDPAPEAEAPEAKKGLGAHAVREDGADSTDADPGSLTPGWHLFTWKNALLGGVAAFTLLGVAVVAYLVMWSTGVGPVGNLVAQGAIAEGERVVLADFADRTDAGLGEVVTEALRVDLQESAVLSLVPPAQVAEAMARMGLPQGTEVTAERAREVAIRDGLKAVIQGEVGAVGSGYLLTASIVEPSRGDVMASFRADAEDDDELLGALDRLSTDIREKAGESLRVIRAGPGLEEVTTSSLEALRLYAEAVEMADLGQEMETIPLLEEALRLDPDFAMAHRKLSAVLGNLGIQPTRMRAAAARAYELRDRLTEREWGLAEAYYLLRVENNPDRAIEAWQRVLNGYPSDEGARNNIGAAALMVGRPADAVQALRPLFADGSRPSPLNYDNFIRALWRVGERDEARSYAERLVTEFPDSRQALEVSHTLPAADREWQRALEGVAARLDAGAGAPGVDVIARTDQAGYYLGLGRVSEARRSLELAERAAVEHRQWEWYWSIVLFHRAASAWALHHPDPEPARAELRRGLATIPLDSLDLRGDAASNAAMLFGLVGWTERADSLRTRIEDAFEPTEKGRGFQVGRQRYLVYRSLGRDDGAAALEALNRLEELAPCPAVCAERIVAGLAFELSGEAERAIEAYEAGLETAPLFWVTFETGFLPLAHDRLGALQEGRGDRAGAAATYQRMIEAYSDAEEPIASRVRRARARAAGLAAGG